MGRLVSEPDRITRNVPGGDRGILRALQAEGVRELAQLYLGAAIVASLVIIAAGTIGFAIGLGLRMLALAAGHAQ